MATHLHLDPVGGIAGDMFAAAMLDFAPHLEEGARQLAQSLLGGEATIVIEPGPFGGFAGRRLKVICRQSHHHRHLKDIVEILDAAAFPNENARAIAIGIFRCLAGAEAAVHGIGLEEVHFHEVGAADSIVDIALAGYLIDATDAGTYSVGALPLGSGTVKTEHGVMPVPAPATARLLEGFAVVDDGIAGERVTPTGAAILHYLKPRMVAVAPAGVLGGSGMGFGTRQLPGRPNALRVMAVSTETAAQQQTIDQDSVTLLAFEVDDQTAEDLAHALDHIRGLAGVRDVLQHSATGKKGRVTACVRVLCEADACAPVREAIFSQTTTLGLREQTVARHVLKRQFEDVDGIPVKLAERPGGITRKAEFESLKHEAGGHAGRERLRRKVESDE